GAITKYFDFALSAAKAVAPSNATIASAFPTVLIFMVCPPAGRGPGLEGTLHDGRGRKRVNVRGKRTVPRPRSGARSRTRSRVHDTCRCTCTCTCHGHVDVDLTVYVTVYVLRL